VAIPVILDTDIGTDVDDVWALAFLLRCPELDIRLITTATGDTRHRAALVAKILSIAGRDDVPIGIGLALDPAPLGHIAWLGDYRLEDYPGPVYEDGVGAICDSVMDSDESVTIIAIGPVPNIAAALVREPQLTKRSSFVGMHGSLRRGYLGAPKAMREYNVKQHALACQAVFAAPWHKTITPLDTCGNILLRDQHFLAVAQSTSPLAEAVIAIHQEWFEVASKWPILGDLLGAMDPGKQSSILYDCVAVYLAFSRHGLQIERLNIVVTDDGRTIIDDAGHSVDCATEWDDVDEFYRLLSQRLS
jgi:inosine-uridine nucleoside N-ribohydrolase